MSNNRVHGAENGIVLGFGDLCGTTNAVVGNQVSASANPCNYSNALRTLAEGNTPTRCNGVGEV